MSQDRHVTILVRDEDDDLDEPCLESDGSTTLRSHFQAANASPHDEDDEIVHPFHPG